MSWDSDTPLPEDAAIKAAFPTRSERHDLYGEAMRLVGARHSKSGLVELVNWLLHERERAEASGVAFAVDWLRTEADRVEALPPCCDRHREERETRSFGLHHDSDEIEQAHERRTTSATNGGEK